MALRGSISLRLRLYMIDMGLVARGPLDIVVGTRSYALLIQHDFQHRDPLVL